MKRKHVLDLITALCLGFVTGALAQATCEMKHEREPREYCIPLYDQPGIERVRCDPIQ